MTVMNDAVMQLALLTTVEVTMLVVSVCSHISCASLSAIACLTCHNNRSLTNTATVCIFTGFPTVSLQHCPTNSWAAMQTE